MAGTASARFPPPVIADSTKLGYATEYRHFEEWAREHSCPAMPSTVEVVAYYLQALADGNVEVRWNDPNTKRPQGAKGTLQVRQHSTRVYQALVYAHRSAEHHWPHAHPAITKVMADIRQKKGTHRKRVGALEIADLRKVLGKMRERRFEDLTILRDRALLTLGFFGACRRSELVALRVEDIEFTPRRASCSSSREDRRSASTRRTTRASAL